MGGEIVAKTQNTYNLLIILVYFLFFGLSSLVWAEGQGTSQRGVLLHTHVDYQDQIPQEWQKHLGPHMSRLLAEKALKNPEVQNTIQQIQKLNSSTKQESKKKKKNTDGSSMIQIGQEPVEQQAKQKNEPRHPRDRRFGVDFVLGFPTGIGVSFRYTPIAPITLEVGVDSSLIAYSFSGEVTVNILPIFMDAKWTPFVSVGYRHIRFTPLVDEAIETLSVHDHLARQNVQTEITLDGTSLHAMSFLGGIDYVGSNGFHFQVSFGRLVQIGSSHLGGHDYFESVEIQNAQSYLGFIKFGKQF